MRHPFAGIIGLETQQPLASSRRTALKVMLAGAGTTLASGSLLAPYAHSIDIEVPRTPTAYLVVPKDFRSFRAEHRHAIGVLGDYYRGAPEGKILRGKSGFLAWLSSAESAEVAAASGVAEVLVIGPDDKPGPGTRRMATKELRVQVVPGGWKTSPTTATFTPTDKLIGQWSKEFASHKDVTFKPGEGDANVALVIGDGEPPREVLSKLKDHPQVVAIDWKYAATTTRVGEDGGATTLAVGEEGGPTTRAVGEEGGSTERLGEEGGITTKALGEEGGPTTDARGEEGGGPTTLRVGEEGGVSTKALGEEGGGSTERLGEEGGATTLALGEEGGSTRALGEEGGVTTKALGEEGGAKPPAVKPK
jgi:hypothetical protein